ncbi:hypothetical protein [Microbulbifer guangxiensis]|uniref:hypothetical protein n=1 Tax=Microbulbifer guangxiensis TaxID=2904249 RepID=UPI001F35F801|nr:hypothetical protein [Microbulbifer guangxiensis]
MNKICKLWRGQDEKGWLHTAFTGRLIIITISAVTLSLIPIIIGAINSSYIFSFSSAGLNFLIFSILKTPVALLAASLVVLSLYVSHYRAKQQDLALRLSRSQSNFSNYFQHKEEIREAITQFKGTLNAPNGHIRNIHLNYHELYHVVYPQAKQSNFACLGLIALINDELQKQISQIQEQFLGKISSGEKNSSPNQMKAELQELAVQYRHCLVEFTASLGVRIDFNLSNPTAGNIPAEYAVRMDRMTQILMQCLNILVEHSFDPACEEAFSKFNILEQSEQFLEAVKTPSLVPVHA